MSYMFPINKLMTEINDQIIKKDEENIMLCVKQTVGYEVDKERLLKALAFDRENYEIGYRDGYNAGLNADKWIPVSDHLPEKDYACYVTVDFGATFATLASLVSYDGKTWRNSDGVPIPYVVKAWQNAPEPYKESEE